VEKEQVQMVFIAECIIRSNKT